MLETQAKQRDTSEPVEVKITGVSISFMDLMVLFFRAALAAIPAMLLAGAAIFGLFVLFQILSL